MINIICGLLGFILAGGLFSLGFYAGVKYEAGRKPVAPELDEVAKSRIEKERERLQREQEAFWQLTGYSADIAYGITQFPEEGKA